MVLVTAAFAAVQLAHSEQLVVRRDASYTQYTAWIADTVSTDPQQRSSSPGDPALTYHSLAYYQVDDVVWPQFPPAPWWPRSGCGPRTWKDLCWHRRSRVLSRC